MIEDAIPEETSLALRQGGGSLQESCVALVVDSQETFELAAEYRRAANDRLAMIDEKIGKPKDAIRRAWQAMQDLYNELRSPWLQVVDQSGRKMGAYTLELARKARDEEDRQRRETERMRQEQEREQRRLQEEAAERARVEQEAAAADAEALGDMEQATALREAPVVVTEVIQPPPPPLPPPPPVTFARPTAEGTSMRTVWKGRGVNIEQLIVAAAEEIAARGHSPLSALVTWDEVALNQKAKAEKRYFRVPGAEAYEEAVASQRSRR